MLSSDSLLFSWFASVNEGKRLSLNVSTHHGKKKKKKTLGFFFQKKMDVAGCYSNILKSILSKSDTNKSKVGM